MHVRRIRTEEDLHEVEIMLFIEAMLKEVEISPKFKEVFETWVAREICNDFGETLISGMGFLLVQEFRKFMY